MSMTQQKVSVIVPVYKVEPYLDPCIESVVNQTYRELEIILVDDGSPDRCPGLCDDWAGRDERIRVVHKQNGGLCSARNAGLDIATGRWVVFVDSDDVVSVHLIQSLMQANTCPKLLCASGYRRFTGAPPADQKPEPAVRTGGKDLVPSRSGYYCWAALYDMQIIRQYGIRFDEALTNLEDVAWNVAYLAYVDELCLIPTSQYFYRVTPNSVTSQCADQRWQVRSWVRTRNSVLRRVLEQGAAAGDIGVLRQFLRRCQNNIFAECISGHLGYGEYAALCRETDWAAMAVFQSQFPGEYACMHHLPWGYFLGYSGALRLRSWLRNLKNRS